jgi:hypothetical protein
MSDYLSWNHIIKVLVRFYEPVGSWNSWCFRFRSLVPGYRIDGYYVFVVGPNKHNCSRHTQKILTESPDFILQFNGIIFRSEFAVQARWALYSGSLAFWVHLLAWVVPFGGP